MKQWRARTRLPMILDALAQAEKAFAAPWRFGAMGSRCFTLDRGYARLTFESFGQPARAPQR